jgi:hypothetical protein
MAAPELGDRHVAGGAVALDVGRLGRHEAHQALERRGRAEHVAGVVLMLREVIERSGLSRLTVGLIVRMTVMVLRSRVALVELPQEHALAGGSFCPSIEVERERVVVEHDALIQAPS